MLRYTHSFYALIAVALLVIEPSMAESRSHFQSFVNKAKKYKIDFPKQWALIESYHSADVLAQAQNGTQVPPSCNLIAQELPEDWDAQVFYDFNFSQLPSLPGYQPISKGDLKMSNKKWQWISFSREVQGVSYSTNSYLFADEKMGFVLSCVSTSASYSSYQDLFHKIASTFKYL